MKTPSIILWFLLLATAASFTAPDTAALDAAFKYLAKLEYGQERLPLQPIEKALKAAERNGSLRRDLEQRLITLVQSQATAAGKDYACRGLKLVGTEKAVPALVALLPEPELSGLARYALETIPGPAVDQALREALAATSGRLKAGVISTLGARRDRQAVAALKTALMDAEPVVSKAAIFALGRIGTPEAAAALKGHLRQGSAPQRGLIMQALLDAGHELLARGNAKAAGELFEELFRQNTHGYLHLAAFQGLLAAQPREAGTRVVQALSGSDGQLRLQAAKFIAEQPGQATPRVILDALGTMPTEGQLAALTALRQRKDVAARGAVLQVVKAGAPEVRVAAVQTLGFIGHAADVDLLAQLAATGPGRESQAARDALVSLPGRAAEDAMIAKLTKADAPQRVELLRGLGTRGSQQAGPAVLPLLDDTDSRVRRAAVSVLSATGTERQVEPLVSRLRNATDETEREALANALGSIAGRTREKALEPVLAGWRAADPRIRIQLLPALSSIGGSRALEAVRTAASDSNAETREAAIRALADWSDPAAAPDLVQVIKTADKSVLRVLAFRGLVRLGRESDAPAEVKLNLLSDAMALAQSPEEKKEVLGALGDIASVRSLHLAAKSLSDPELADEAGAAIVRIGAVLDTQYQEEAAGVLQQVLKTAKAKSVLDDAGRQLRGLGGGRR